MSARRRDGGDTDPADRAALDAALSGVKPLRRGAVLARPSSRTATKPAPRVREESPPEQHPFQIVTSGERVEGVAVGVDRAWLRRLRAGDVRVESRVDLHGLNARSAHVAVRRALERAHADGRRCVLVVHGRGLHSPEGPVLRAFLLRWLTESRVAPIVMAFASARPRDGGDGATYVLLRRSRA
ncbi:MAG TPA: DNA mismatch repair protein MutS [Deltaproteobacteria bacterium]|jgi:DNA-nicking Smr family endonuclease|nr:DNA mismatch repair protein MutS [Deltaproteobacteria bacterium]